MDRKERIRRAGALLVAVLAVSRLAAGRPQDRPNEQQRSERVSGEGCVKAGVESGCVLLVTWDENNAAKRTYLVIGKNRPSENTVVRFVGETQPDTMTTCMQGTPVALTEFVDLQMECPIKDEAGK